MKLTTVLHLPAGLVPHPRAGKHRRERPAAVPAPPVDGRAHPLLHSPHH